MVFVDIHCHLDYDSFDEDRNELVTKLKEAKIVSYTNTFDKQSYLSCKELFKGQDHIKVCPGLYPQHAEKVSDLEMREYCDYLRAHADEFEAIGEVGLDKYHTTDEKLFAIQVKHFKTLVELAHELDKALIIHARKAEEEVICILKDYVSKTGFKKFDLHCFMGKKKYIKDIKEMGIYCSIPLIVLNTQSFQLLVEELPTRQLLVETDSPFLDPSKERNSPLNVPKIYAKIAEIKGLDQKEIEQILYKNYMKFIM